MVHVLGGTTEIFGKVNILLQTFLSRGKVNSFSLMSDLSFITQVQYRNKQNKNKNIDAFAIVFNIFLRKRNISYAFFSTECCAYCKSSV